MPYPTPQSIRVATTGRRLKTRRAHPSAPATDALPMDEQDGSPSLWHVIAHTVEEARNRGLDEYRQYDRAVRATLRVEPNLTLLAAARLVNAYLELHDQHCGLTRFTALIARSTARAEP